MPSGICDFEANHILLHCGGIGMGRKATTWAGSRAEPTECKNHPVPIDWIPGILLLALGINTAASPLSWSQW